MRHFGFEKLSLVVNIYGSSMFSASFTGMISPLQVGISLVFLFDSVCLEVSSFLYIYLQWFQETSTRLFCIILWNARREEPSTGVRRSYKQNNCRF